MYIGARTLSGSTVVSVKIILSHEIYFLHTSLSAVPGAPRNVMADGSMEDCMILVTWNPPADAGGSDYTYRVDVPSRNITASTNSSTESTLHVPNCADGILIQVYVVNRFGCLKSSETRLRLQSRPTESPSK